MLGRGGGGQVYSCYLKSDPDQKYALKKVEVYNKSSAKTLKRELQIL